MSFSFCPDQSAVVNNSCIPECASLAHMYGDVAHPVRPSQRTITVDSSAHDHTPHVRASSDDIKLSIRISQNSNPFQSKIHSKSSNALNSPRRKSTGGAGPVGASKWGREGFHDLFGTEFEPVRGRGSSRSKRTRQVQGKSEALAYGTVGFVNGAWEEEAAKAGSYFTEYRRILLANQDIEGESENSGVAWKLDFKHGEPIDTAGMEKDSLPARLEHEMVSDTVYRQLLRRYVHLRGDIQTWSDYFFIQEGRRPQMSDVDATRIQYLHVNCRSYLLARGKLVPLTNSPFRCQLFAEACSRFVQLSTAPVGSTCVNPQSQRMDDVDEWIDAKFRGERGSGASRGG